MENLDFLVALELCHLYLLCGTLSMLRDLQRLLLSPRQMLFALIAASLVKSFAPYAAGSGISEIKCIIAGFVMKGFLGAWTLLIKSIALPLAIASGLSVGKEGPSVHFAVCAGNVISRLFSKYKQSASKTREVLTATAAAGVAVAFGSPIGGVLFSLEAMNPFRTGQLVMFQVQYDRTWHFFELIFFIFLGVFGGLYGAFVIKWNLRVQAFRKKYLSQHAVMESVVLAAITAVLCYPNMFLKINMTEMMEILFRECEGGHDYHGLCDGRFGNGGIADRMIWSNGFPFLDNKEDHVFNAPVSHAMTADPVTLPASDFPVREAEHLLNDNKFQGFPIVDNRTKKTLVGYIGRTELRYAIDRARAEGILSPNARCVFTKEAAEASVARRASSSSPHHLAPDTFDAIQQTVGSSFVDFSRYADHTPLTVHPRLPLETVIEIFKKIGPRVILVEHRGRLTGLVTVKDCLKYQFKVEAQEHALAATQASEGPLGDQTSARSSDTLEERVWNFIQRVGSKLPRWRPAGRVALSDRHEGRGISTGTDDENDRLMELEERQ
ncbi:unnamed protein product [Aspergillus oryzae]|nr:unnamed protein product [Aspergillus oryzae]